jgi:hypothetical protein
MMQAWTRGLEIASLCVALGCSGSRSSGGEEDDREDLSGDEEEQSESPGDSCEGQTECAWWKGRVLIEGTWWELDEISPRMKVQHCFEPELQQVITDLSIPSDLVPGSLDRIVLHISADPKKVQPGTDHPAQRSDRGNPARALAYLSIQDRGASAVFPDGGSLRYETIEEQGIVDLFFELDYGDLGAVTGRIKADSTQPKVCLMPSGPEPVTR